MEEITEKFTRVAMAICSPLRLATLVRQSERTKDGDKINFLGRNLITHCTKQIGENCSKCCFDYVDELCDFVSCMPEEREANDWCYFTIEPEGKEASHE